MTDRTAAPPATHLPYSAAPSAAAPPPELLHIDMVRFVASVGIVLAHSLEFFFTGVNRDRVHELGGGLSLFVDVFFVLSGFIMAYVYDGRVEDARAFGLFMQRRVGRLIPLHWLMLAVWTVLLLVIQSAGIAMKHAVVVTPQCVATAAFLLNSFVACGNEVPNGVNWSISAEMVMYVAFPLFVRLGRGSRLRSFALAAFAIVLTVFAFGGSRGWIGHEQALRALPGFLLGMALYRVRDRLGRLPKGVVSIGLWGCLGLILIGGSTGIPDAWLLPVAYLVGAFAVAADFAPRAAPTVVRRLAPLGQLTYSIYMIHPLVIFVSMNAIGDKFLHLSGAPAFALGMVCYAAIYVLSRLSFDRVETPARRWIDGLPLFGTPIARGSK